jgi:hypothetical protein
MAMEETISSVNNEKINIIKELWENWWHFLHIFICDRVYNSNVSLDKQPHRRHHVQLPSKGCLTFKILRKKIISLVLFCLLFYVYIYIYILIRLKIKPNSVRIRFLSCQIFVLPIDGIWTHTIDTLQHQSLSLMSSALDHSTTSAPY